MVRALNHKPGRVLANEIEITCRVTARRTAVSKTVTRMYTAPENLTVWSTMQKEVGPIVELVVVQGPINAVQVSNQRKVNAVMANREW